MDLRVVNLKAIRDYADAATGELTGRPEANGPWQKAARRFLAAQLTEDQPLLPLCGLLEAGARRNGGAAVQLQQFGVLMQLLVDALGPEDRAELDRRTEALWASVGAGGRNAMTWAALIGAIVLHGVTREYLQATETEAEDQPDASADSGPEGSPGD